jgi:hypothetical protein
MATAGKPLRQPGLVVYLSGLGTSALVLWLVRYLNEDHQFNIMGWYVNGILPVGAIAVGILSGLGYAVASRLLQVKLSRAFVLGMLTTAIADYAAAQYVTYTQILEQQHVGREQYSFMDYVRQICEGMAFCDRATGKPGSPLGAWGYLFKLLEIGGYALGALIPSAMVFGMPYCKKCQKYLTAYRTGHIHSPNSWSSVKRLGKQARLKALQEAVGALSERVRQITSSMAAAPLAETEAAVAALEPALRKDAAARVTFALKKCPTCEAHHVEVTLNTHSVDKRPVTKSIAKFDKTEPGSGENSPG